MKRRFTLVAGSFVVGLTLLATTPQAQSSGSSVKGSGTVGQLPKWVGGSGPTVDVGNSIITETGSGRIGIGTTAPASKLTVAGTIESTLGGYKFPDNTVQTTAALASVVHDATLAGIGSVGSPLGVAAGGIGATQLASNAVTAAKITPGNVVKGLNGLTDNVTLAAGPGVTLTPAANTITIAAAAADNPELNAVQFSAALEMSGDVTEAEATIPVPAGKRLVIEYISFVVDTNKGDLGFLKVQTNVGGRVVNFFFDRGAQIVDKLVRIYSDTDVKLQVGQLPGNFDNTFLSISGHFVDLP